MKRLQTAVMTAFSLVVAVGCGEGAPVDQLPSDVLNDTGNVEQHASVSAGDTLFKNEMFWGNNRTCTTCHGIATGTVNPSQIVNRGWGDPIIRKLDSDNPASSNETYDLLRTHATINVTLTLPSNIRLANSSARTVTVRRGIPTTNDMPAFDTMIMFDGREASLQSQARSAVSSHYQAGRLPTTDEQNSIALFEKTLFSSTALRNYAAGTGPAPGIPAGNTDAEKRGAAWFAPTALCGSCHAGTLLNKMTAGNPMGLPAGTQFGTALVSERNKLNNPVQTYIVTNPDNSETQVTTADPGLMLATGDAATANLFKMLSLRNLKNTAPYFHDNSAKTIEDIMDQYNFLMNTLGIPHTTQDISDLTAYLKLL